MTPEIAKEFPSQACMTLRRYTELFEFDCALCGKTTMSKLQAETPDGPACNGCYGQRKAEYEHMRDLHDPTLRP